MGNLIRVNKDLIKDKKLSDRARMVYIYISAYNEDVPFGFQPDKVAKGLRMNKTTLYKYLKELIDAGWIERQYKHVDGKVVIVEYITKDKDGKE